jgi:hypothetical protein
MVAINPKIGVPNLSNDLFGTKVGRPVSIIISIMWQSICSLLRSAGLDLASVTVPTREVSKGLLRRSNKWGNIEPPGAHAT